jgi:uncharacterized protein YjiS (DUF1127 family)
MMAGSTTRSKQRPDTLMQDRTSARSTKPLATHGRTIHWVKMRRTRIEHMTALESMDDRNFQLPRYDCRQTLAELEGSGIVCVRPWTRRSLACTSTI